MNLAQGARALRKRYELIERVHGGAHGEESAMGTAETWLSLEMSEYGQEYLLRLRAHRDDESSSAAMNRALWDAQVRTLCWACSSPGAEQFLMLMTEDCADQESRFLIAASEAPESTYLADELGERHATNLWLIPEGAESHRTHGRHFKAMITALVPKWRELERGSRDSTERQTARGAEGS
jgi:hypothetical protein